MCVCVCARVCVCVCVCVFVFPYTNPRLRSSGYSSYEFRAQGLAWGLGLKLKGLELRV